MLKLQENELLGRTIEGLEELNNFFVVFERFYTSIDMPENWEMYFCFNGKRVKITGVASIHSAKQKYNRELLQRETYLSVIVVQ